MSSVAKNSHTGPSGQQQTVRQQSAPAIIRTISQPAPERRVLNDHGNPPGNVDTATIIQTLQDLINKMCSVCTRMDRTGVDYGLLQKSSAFNQYKSFTPQLKLLDLSLLTDAQKTALYINIYNALTLDGLLVLPSLPQSVLDVKFFWKTTCYNVGGHVFSLEDITHGLLRGNRTCPGSRQVPFAAGDPRLPYCVQKLDPRVHFALVVGAKWSPALQSYSSTDVDTQLTQSVRVYCERFIKVYEPQKQIYVSSLLQWYRLDFGNNDLDAIRWTLKYMEEDKAKALSFLLHTLEKRGMVDIMYEQFDWALNDISVTYEHNGDVSSTAATRGGASPSDADIPLLRHSQSVM